MSATVQIKSANIQIPGYRVLGPLGEGGMASVYLALQESLDREVALKVMAPALAANAEFTERFLKEGRITAKLSHANLVTVFDIGSHGGMYYLAAEYIPGGTLKERIARGPLAPAEALDVAVDIARGLDYAHDRGFVHRDVKPGNILFKKDGTAVLADFGIAKAMDGKTGATMAGASIGTPDYMSPEQARAEQVDGRSDLYSLGAVVYEMLTGEPPYQAGDPFTVALMHVTQPVPELPAQLRWLQPLVDALMAKSLDQRVATGEDFIHQVEQLLAASPEAAAMGPLRSPARRGGRFGNTATQRRELDATPSGRRPLFAAVVVVLVAAVAAAAWWWWPGAPGIVPDGVPGGSNVTVPRPADPPSTVGGDDIGLLLEQADAYYAQGIKPENGGRRLDFPEDDSAVGLYRRVLELDPGNERAKEGLRDIGSFYHKAASSLCGERALWSVCRTNALKGLNADPDNEELKKLLQLAEARLRGD